MTKRFTYHRIKPGTYDVQLHGHVEVRDAQTGERIGQLNKTRDGYALRNLEGKLIDVVYLNDRETCAGLLASKVRESH